MNHRRRGAAAAAAARRRYERRVIFRAPRSSSSSCFILLKVRIRTNYMVTLRLPLNQQLTAQVMGTFFAAGRLSLGVGGGPSSVHKK